jgi:hypothetical protein
MSFDPHFRRFRPSWLFPASEMDEEKTSAAFNASSAASDEELSSELTERDVDEAIEQIASEGYCVCPLCGAIVGSDGSVLG